MASDDRFGASDTALRGFALSLLALGFASCIEIDGNSSPEAEATRSKAASFQTSSSTPSAGIDRGAAVNGSSVGAQVEVRTSERWFK